MLISLITIFCLIWRITATDGRLTTGSDQIIVGRDSRQDSHVSTLQHVKSTASNRVNVYIPSKVHFNKLADGSELRSGQHMLDGKKILYTRSILLNSQPSLISRHKNKNINVNPKKSGFTASEWPKNDREIIYVTYHRERRGMDPQKRSGDVAPPNGNLISPRLPTVPRDIQDTGDAHINSEPSVSVRSSNAGIAVAVELNSSTATGIQSPSVQGPGEPLAGYVQPNENGSIRESPRSQQANNDNIVSAGSQTGDTPEVNAQRGVVDHPVDVAVQDRVVIGPSEGSVQGNYTERQDQSNVNVVPSSQRSGNTSREVMISDNSAGVSRNGSDSNGFNETNNNLNSNTSAPSGALSPAVIIDDKKMNEQTHPSNEQDNATETEKSRSDQNSSSVIHPTYSTLMAVSASSMIFPSLGHFESSLTTTIDRLFLVTTYETTPALQTNQTVQSEMNTHSLSLLARTDNDVFSSPTSISSTSTRDITSSSGNARESYSTIQTDIIQPTGVLLPTLSTDINTAPYPSLQYNSFSVSRTKSNIGISNPGEIVTTSSVNQELKTYLPIRIATSSVGPLSSTEIATVSNPRVHTVDLTSNSDVYSTTGPSFGHLVPSTSLPWSAATVVTDRASSRDTPRLVASSHTSTPTLAAAHPSGAPPPIAHGRPDAPELLQSVTAEADLTEPHHAHPDVDDDQVEGKTTSTFRRSSQGSADQQRNRGSSMHITTDSTVKSTSSAGNRAVNETESPTSYIELKLGMSWPNFCHEKIAIFQELVDILQVHVNSVGITADQIQVMDREAVDCVPDHVSDIAEILVRMYLTNITHQFDRNLTLQCATILQAVPLEDRKNSIITSRLLAINVYDREDRQDGQTTSDDNLENGEDFTSDDSTDHRVTLAIALAVVGGCCCVGLIILQVIVRRRNKDSNSSPLPSVNSSYSHSSSDSIQLASVIKSRPNSGLVNPGLDILEPPEPSHPMNFMQLSNFCIDVSKIEEEFQKLPQRMPRPSMVPAGEEDKNRYANIVPLVHTRVKLVQDGPVPRSSYINANYVTGPNNQCQYYIATQAPTEKTTVDFWTMIWQQGCQTIVMLTDLEEQGQIKCASYWPELVGKSAAHKYGDFLIELIRKDVHQEYIISRVEINNQRKIETRQIDHFWYTCWPPHGLPEPISLVKLVLDVRPKYENGTSPLVVHCSPGTGRTCTFIALDLCMKQFETRRIVDIMKTVNSIRQERAGAIQNKEQYTLLYNAVHEYAAIVMTPGISATSSAATLQALLSS